MSERRINSWEARGSAHRLHTFQSSLGGDAYLSNITADLTHSGQVLYCGHPFFRTQSCLSREVVQVCDQTLQDIPRAWVRAL